MLATLLYSEGPKLNTSLIKEPETSDMCQSRKKKKKKCRSLGVYMYR
jgi:hypothetical protein